MVDNEFAGQTAVVTGAANGLGQAVARLLAERGARVVIADIDAEGAEAEARAINERGRQAVAIPVDVTKEDDVARFHDEVRASEEPVTVLINVAGAYPHKAIREITAADWDYVFDINLKSTFLMTRAFMDDMIAAGGGRIVNVASSDAYIPKPTLVHYAAAKAGVLSLTKTMAAELAPNGVLVNGVSPGAIATERSKGQSWLAERIPQIPVRRAAEPADIGEVILFLASPRNVFIVGETVIVNGGTTMV
jgi:3-oxoacyl-[acyl-carrier protein] reductase